MNEQYKSLRMTLWRKRFIPFFCASFILSACGGGGSSDPSPTQTSNKYPTVSVGSDFSIDENAEAALSSSSSDSDGSITLYSWEQIGGTSITLINADTATSTFTAPEVTEDEVLTFELTVTDNDGAASTDSVSVTVIDINKLPVADAGTDQTIDENLSFSLEGTGTDPDGTIASFSWSQTAGPTATIIDGSKPATTVLAPEVTDDEVLTFELIVTDNSGATASDSMSVMVNNVNKLPTANAGANQATDENVEITLVGSGADPDGSITNYGWTQLSGPTVSLVNSNSASLTFTAPEVSSIQELVFQLTVTDNQSAQATDSVTVTVNDTDVSQLISNVAPAFGIAGTEITIQVEGAAVTTDAMISLGGALITPTSTTANSLVFDIPDSASSGAINVVQASTRSNSVWFSVTENGLAAYDESKLYTDPSGIRYVMDYLLVRVTEAGNTLDNAQRLASLISGEVIGRYSDLRWWQISSNAETLEDLRALSSVLTTDSSVENVSIDTISDGDDIDWADDPDLGLQRDRNNVEEGAELYESLVSLTDSEKALPYFMSIGVSEGGIDFSLPDFDNYLESSSSAASNITIYTSDIDSSTSTGKHGSNVVGIIAGELGDAGNAGLISALTSSHAGANIKVASRASSSTISLGNRLASTLEMIKNGAKVINWSWGLHRRIDIDANEDGATSYDEISAGAEMCTGDYTNSNPRGQAEFNSYSDDLETFFETVEKDYPSVVIVTSAGNGSTDAGDTENRMPSAFASDQLIVVAAHSSGAQKSASTSEDQYNTLIGSFASGILAGRTFPTCYGSTEEVGLNRSYYSNYGNRVDIAASGSIVGFQNDTLAGNWGTSYATPVVTATVALMQSINPNLTPLEIKSLLRSSALPIEHNTVTLPDGENTVFTRSLSTFESSENTGMGARLNVEGAIQAAVDSLEGETLTKGDTVAVSISGEATQATATIEVTIPGDSPVFDAADIMFIVDVSGSYSDDLSTFQSSASDLIDAFSSVGTDVQIGVSSFSDFPIYPYGSSYAEDYAFQLDQPLTKTHDLVSAALDSLTIRSGNDWNESQLEAIYQTAQSETGWRKGALPVIFLATDATFHNSDDNSAYPGAGYTETLEALTSLGAIVYGLQSGGDVDDVIEITAATGGESFSLSRNSSEVVASVLSAVDSASSDLTISLSPVGDFYTLVSSIVPLGDNVSDDGLSIEGVNPGDTVSFDVTFERDFFELGETHILTFRLLVNANDVSVIQEIPVVLTLN